MHVDYEGNTWKRRIFAIDKYMQKLQSLKNMQFTCRTYMYKIRMALNNICFWIAVAGQFAFLNVINQHIAWWCHPMEIFSALLAIRAGNSPVLLVQSLCYSINHGRRFKVYPITQDSDFRKNYGRCQRNIHSSCYPSSPILLANCRLTTRHFWPKLTKRTFVNTRVWKRKG